MNVVLISTYDLGRQPFGLSSPAAWLARSGHEVKCLDLTIERLDDGALRSADLIAFHVPMHTATRIAASFVERVRHINQDAYLCFYGLYAPLNADYLRKLGAYAVLGGEFEAELVALADRLSGQEQPEAPPIDQPIISLARQTFIKPERSNLPPLKKYAFVVQGANKRRVTGYTETTRGCKHLCRHCPIVPVYRGHFRVIQRVVVLDDIRAQVNAGAEHITFGDPDFFNGPGHAQAIVEALHQEFPDLTYDVTIKIEHLLQHARLLPVLKRTGCLFITSAVESNDEHILDILQKGHTVSDFVKAVALCRANGLVLNPTFVTFTPWTTLESYRNLLKLVADLDLVEQVAPVQYAIRLLVPAGSLLLELPEVRHIIEPFDEHRLCYPWIHQDPRVDDLFEQVLDVVKRGQERDESRRLIFNRIWKLAWKRGDPAPSSAPVTFLIQNDEVNDIPYLSEPWYC